MTNLKNLRPALLACAVLIALPAALAAGEPEDNEDSRIVIVNDDSEVVIDMEAVNEIVTEAMAGMGDVMAELEDMQFQMHLGRDNRLNLSYEDTTFELDLDQVLAHVGEALEAGLADLDTEDWTYTLDRWDSADEQELRRELEKLKDEMGELRKELRKVKDD